MPSATAAHETRDCASIQVIRAPGAGAPRGLMDVEQIILGTISEQER